MIVVIVWTVLAIFAATFVVETAFLMVSSAKRAIDAGVRLPFEIRCVAYFWFAVGLVADVAFNVSRGTIIFRELPRELLFTSRVKRHCRESATKSVWRYRKACAWREVLNAIDDGHIK